MSSTSPNDLESAVHCRPCELDAAPQRPGDPYRRLFARRWGAEDASHVFVIVHGLGEHGGCYESFATFVAESGMATLVYDQHGHGLSPGRRGTISEFDVFMQDIGLAMQAAAENWPDRPRILLGHSMGGNFALRYCMETIYGPRPDRLVLSNPMIMPPISPSRDQVFAAWLTGKVLPDFRISSKTDPRQLTTDEDVITEILYDPFMHHHMLLETGTQLVTQGQWLLDHADWLTVPTLMMLGLADEMTDQDAIRQFAADADAVNQFESFAGLKHNLLRETKRDEVYRTMIQWLQA